MRFGSANEVHKMSELMFQVNIKSAAIPVEIKDLEPLVVYTIHFLESIAVKGF